MTTITIRKIPSENFRPAPCFFLFVWNYKSHFITLYFKVLFMDKQKYLDDLHDIRHMMERSSRFISLSGISGILAGTLALIASFFVYRTIAGSLYSPGYRIIPFDREIILLLLGIGTGTLILSIGAGIFFTSVKAKKDNQKLWDHQTRRLVINLSIPLVTGGLLCLILLFEGFIGLMAPITLIFYGLALVNASKYTLSEIRSLGLIEIIIGLLATLFIQYGLWFWSFGFGILHIIYGIAMQRKYGS
jgi:hypothetical protein